MHHVAELVGENLDFDVARIADQLFHVDAAVFETRFRFGGRACKGAFEIFGRSTTRMPFPPPPAVALSSTG